jgi:hypothetical protein
VQTTTDGRKSKGEQMANVKILIAAAALAAATPLSAEACIATVAIDQPTQIFAGPDSDRVLWTLAPPDQVCLVEILPGAHPAGVHFMRLSHQHGGYMDRVQEPEMSAQPTTE